MYKCFVFAKNQRTTALMCLRILSLTATVQSFKEHLVSPALISSRPRTKGGKGKGEKEASREQLSPCKRKVIREESVSFFQP